MARVALFRLCVHVCVLQNGSTGPGGCYGGDRSTIISSSELKPCLFREAFSLDRLHASAHPTTQLTKRHTRTATMLHRSRGGGGGAARVALLLLGAVLGYAVAFLQPQSQPARSRGATRILAKRVSFGDKGLDQLIAGINVVGDAVRVCFLCHGLVWVVGGDQTGCGGVVRGWV